MYFADHCHDMASGLLATTCSQAADVRQAWHLLRTCGPAAGRPGLLVKQQHDDFNCFGGLWHLCGVRLHRSGAA